MLHIGKEYSGLFRTATCHTPGLKMMSRVNYEAESNSFLLPQKEVDLQAKEIAGRGEIPVTNVNLARLSVAVMQ